jgi:hypothetical protein
MTTWNGFSQALSCLFGRTARAIDLGSTLILVAGAVTDFDFYRSAKYAFMYNFVQDEQNSWNNLAI